jgi:hypothetical protein
MRPSAEATVNKAGTVDGRSVIVVVVRSIRQPSTRARVFYSLVLPPTPTAGEGLGPATNDSDLHWKDGSEALSTEGERSIPPHCLKAEVIDANPLQCLSRYGAIFSTERSPHTL